MESEPSAAPPLGKPRCFIISPISTPDHLVDRYRRDSDHFRHVIDKLLMPAAAQAGFTVQSPIRAGSENIQAAIIKDLQDSDLVLADLSTLNANVFFELGIRTALDRPVCLVWDGMDRLPFDASTINSHQYGQLTFHNIDTAVSNLVAHIRASWDDTSTRNELWRYFGSAVPGPLSGSPGLDPSDASIVSKLDTLLEMVERRPNVINVINRDDYSDLVPRRPPSEATESRKGRFEVYQDSMGEYRYRLKSSSGQIIAVGEAHNTKEDVMRAIEAVKAAADG